MVELSFIQSLVKPAVAAQPLPDQIPSQAIRPQGLLDSLLAARVSHALE